jgi:hypothetical protein
VRAAGALCGGARVASRALLGLALFALSPVASAETPREQAKAAFDEAERASRALRFAEALAAYKQALALDPSAPFAPAARTRAADLAAHAEGGFAPLVALERVRRDPKRLRDPESIDALAREAASFPDGRVRGEARLVAAEAYGHALADPARARTLLGEVTADTSADGLTRALALRELVTLDEAAGDLDAAREAVLRHGDLAPAVRDEVLRLVRRRTIRRVSLAWLAALGLAGALAAFRVAKLRGVRDVPRALVRPLAVGFALYVGGGGAVLARFYGTDDPRPFLWLGLGVLALDVVARALRLASSRAGRLVASLRVLACVVGVVAVAFLALERTQAGYLESFGL